MQLIYILACLNLYLLNMRAVCQAESPTDKKKQNIKNYTLDEAIAVWENNNCIFPAESWYKLGYSLLDDLENSLKLEPCRKLEKIKDPDSDVMFKKQLCRAFYLTSFSLCEQEKMDTFVKKCLIPVALNKIPPLSTDSICMHINASNELCRHNCGDSSDLRNVCELFAQLFYQYEDKKCLYQKDTQPQTTSPETIIKDTLDKESVDKPLASAGGKNEKKISVSTIIGIEDVTNISPSTTMDITTSKLTSQAPEKGSSQSKSTSEIPKVSLQQQTTAESQRNSINEAKTTPILLETTSTIVTPDQKFVEPNTSFSLELSTQLTSTSKPIILPLLKSTTKADAVDPDSVSTPELKTTPVVPEPDETIGDDAPPGDLNNKSPEDTDSGEEETINDKADENKNIPQVGNIKPDKENGNDEDQLPIEKGKIKTQPKDKLKGKEPNELSTNTDIDGNPGSGHFLAYFLTAVVICISGYIIYHNKQKILAFIIEGRNGGRNGRQRSKDVKYTQLKSNVEEVLPSLEQTATSKNFVY